MNAICAQVIDLAKRQLGYKESGVNQTKYSRFFDVEAWQWFNTKKQGAEWCAIFICWLFAQNETLGQKQALSFLGCPAPKDNCAAGVPYLFDYLAKKGYKLVDKSKGQPGDIIVLYSKKHVGMIEEVKNGKYITIEGNKGNYVAHGSYGINSSTITAVFHPDWDKAHFFQQKEEKPADPAHDPAPAPAAPVQTVYTVNTNKDPLRLRTQPNTSCPTICLMPKGSKVTLIQVVNKEWMKVKYRTMTGYAYRKYLK